MSRNVIVIIPARYNSKRFPGKPLVDIQGKSMIERVYEQTSKAVKNVYVATDDKRIVDCVKDFKGNVVMTSPHHKSGTDRCAEALNIIETDINNKYDIVVNVQGDEPFIQPEQLNKLLTCFDDETTEIATLVKVIDNPDEIFDENTPKVVLNKNMQALYFSRSTIPFLRDIEKSEWIKKHIFYQHIGIYGFKVDVLRKITTLTPSSLEIAESLEQLRWLENGFKIKVASTEYNSIGIDTLEDLKKII